MFTISAAALDWSGIFEWVAKAGAGIAAWASVKAQPAEPSQPLDTEGRIQQLVQRERFKANHPWQHRAKQITRWFREEI